MASKKKLKRKIKELAYERDYYYDEYVKRGKRILEYQKREMEILNCFYGSKDKDDHSHDADACWEVSDKTFKFEY